MSLGERRARARSAVFDAATLRTLGKGAYVYMDPGNATLMHVALSPGATIPLAGRLGIQQANPPILVDSLLNTPVLNGNIPGGLLVRPRAHSATPQSQAAAMAVAARLLRPAAMWQPLTMSNGSSSAHSVQTAFRTPWLPLPRVTGKLHKSLQPLHMTDSAGKAMHGQLERTVSSGAQRDGSEHRAGAQQPAAAAGADLGADAAGRGVRGRRRARHQLRRPRLAVQRQPPADLVPTLPHCATSPATLHHLALT